MINNPLNIVNIIMFPEFQISFDHSFQTGIVRDIVILNTEFLVFVADYLHSSMTVVAE